jgi:hypothetical protein
VQEAGWDPEPVWTERLEEKSLALAKEEYTVRKTKNDKLI